ncbi:hypothetical protein GCM10023083_62090 [Streptomyces phyllanthi]
MTPGSPTDRSRSPAATRTVLTLGVTVAAASADGNSVEDMRQCYETITQWFMCSPSQTPFTHTEVRPPFARARRRRAPRRTPGSTKADTGPDEGDRSHPKVASAPHSAGIACLLGS